jgi:ankyrin repeat protein
MLFFYEKENKSWVLFFVFSQNWTPLMCACASNHPVTCAFLLSHNADLCAINDRGMTAFHLAAFLGSLSVLQELLSSSSNDEILLKAINQGDHRNQTALFYACVEGHLDIALTLLRAGANAYHLDNDEQTCLHAMLSSSIILKRHIHLFYSLIQFVDYHLNQDYLGRTLLDLAYLNQLKTIIHLLLLLNYKTNSDIVFHREQIESLTYHNAKRTLSLRQICIIHFKRSIIYQRNQRQSTQRELLVDALQQTFHIIPYRDLPNVKENRLTENSIGKSLDDISLLHHHQQLQSNKYQKNLKSTKNREKKMRKTASIFSTATTTSSTNKWSSQIDLQHTHSTWSTLTNKFKGQRLPPITTGTQQIPIDQQINSLQLSTTNPMKHLALDLLTSPTKLDHLLDFPSLNNNHLLYEDLKMSINTYNLTGPDVLNQN